MLQDIRSTSNLNSPRWASLTWRGSDYFGMSGPVEFIAAATLFALLIALNILNVLHEGFNSDEPQHLHVIWGWAHGFVQYRDLFDNHMPLFHIMLAPIFGLISERATILYWMRFILLPMYFVVAWCTYQIGTQLFSRRAGIWAVIAVGFYADYRFVALEFRTDNLWAPLWLLCIVVLIRGKISAHRALVAGLLLGLCFGVSMKSTIFLLSLLVSTSLVLAFVGPEKLGTSWRYLAQCGAVFLAAMAIIPGAIMIFFALKGVWPDFRYCVFDHNFLANPDNTSHPLMRAAMFPVTLGAFAYVARWVIRAADDSELGFHRGFVLLICVSYILLLKSFWPLPEPDDYPPFYPLAFVIFIGGLLALSEELARLKWNIRHIFRIIPLPVFVAIAECAYLFVAHPLWKNGTRGETNLLRDVLALTRPDDYVFDCKGETVFRRRCFRPVIEKLTMERIRRGIMAANIPQRCVETRTCVVATPMIERFPPTTLSFVKSTYLRVTDQLRVAGTSLQASTTTPHRFDFEVVIPASYKIISRDGSVSGTLDGTPYDGARFLAPGPHAFESRSPLHSFILLWAPAVDRGFTPTKYD